MSKKNHQAAVARLIEQAFTIFRHDELKRIEARARAGKMDKQETITEIVTALRKLKTRILSEVCGAGFKQWLTKAEAMIDVYIETLTGDHPLPPQRQESEMPKPKLKIKLPRWMRRKTDGGNSFSE